MKKVIAYLRCSSDVQSTEHQRSSVQAYATKNNLTVNEFIIDEAISAYKTNIWEREGMTKVISMVKADQVSDLLIFESSRIARNMIQYQQALEILTSHRVLVHSTSDNTILNANDIDKLLNAFKGWIAEQSSVETSKRVKSAHELLRQQGKFVAGSVPWGFELVNGYLTVKPDHKELITSLYEDYINLGTKEVQIKYSIKNRKTLIDRISNKVYKPIVGEYLWTQANEVRTKRRCIKNNETSQLNKSDILFEGLLYHAECGRRLYVNRDYRTENHSHYYRCKYCRGNKDITAKKSFSGTKLDAYLEEHLGKVLLELSQKKLEEYYKSSMNKHLAIDELKLEELQENIKLKEKARTMANAKLERYILEDKPDSLVESVANMINGINIELEELNKQTETITKHIKQQQEQSGYQKEFISKVLGASETYAIANTQQKKSILQLLIKRIDVKDINDCDIFLNI